MSLQNKGLWVLKDNGPLTDGEMGGETSLRIEQKRAHQFFMDASEGELFSNKKQALQSVSDKPISTPASLNFSFWGNAFNSQSAPLHSSDRSRAPEPLGTFSFGDTNVFSSGNENVTTERNRFMNLLQNNSTVSLSMSYAGEDPVYQNAGTREARVNLANEYTSGYPFSLRNSSNIGEDSINATAVGLTYSAGIGNVISMGHDFAEGEQTATPIGNTVNKVNGNRMLMGHQYGRGDCSLYLMDQSFDKGNGYYRTANQPFMENGNFTPIPSYGKVHENFISMFPSYSKANENFMPVGLTGNAEIGVAFRCPTPDKVVEAVISTGTCSKENSSFISMSKGERATISFGEIQQEHGGNNPSDKVISSYDMLISESSLEASESLTERSTVEHSADQIEIVAPETTVRTENMSKQKAQKTPKSSPNNFPSNVKSLLSTGMLDGVPVKYVSWSREKTVRGIIKGTGYLCGCNDCKLSKNLNAFEFERHAACKTKHPNNHIYFENGKTIYAVVQELKNTPQEKLFEAIQNITGSPINQKNFQTWKASYQAASRELQRIYEKTEVAKPS
ncbi:uncharacterized protein LOC142170804 [Nicotiana tabacum]|uniref:Tify domain-containing protein n=2 Tax=Nicotiana tabacum TaxID=4097 RepID=A0A1S3YPR1_TOBAC|nr:PREDICTED: uncharacterized protein LOC107778463 [Nicotiana tabacum]